MLTKYKLTIYSLILAGVIGFLSTACGGATPQQKAARFIARGIELVKNGDHARAILEFSNAVAIRPNDAEAYYQLALAQLGAGDAGSAVSNLAKATKLDPKHAGAQLKIAEFLSSEREKASLLEAEKRIRVVLEQSPNNPDALNVLAIAGWGLGKKQEAEVLLNQAFAQAPANVKSTVSLARLKLVQKDIAGAEQVLQKAVSSEPGSTDLLTALGNFYLAVNNPVRAEEQYRRVLEIDPKKGAVLAALADIKMRGKQIDEAGLLYERASALSDPRFRSLHAMFLFETGKRDAAIAEFEKLAARDKADRTVRSHLVSAYEAVNRIADAEKVLAAAIQKNPRDGDALLQRSQLELRSGHYVEAQADLAKIALFHPNSALVHYLTGIVHGRRGAQFSQRQWLGDAVRIDPEFLAARLQLAQLLITMKSARAALDLLNEAPPGQKDLLAVRIQKNWAFVTLGQYTEARKGIDQALSSGRPHEALLQDAALKFAQHDPAGGRASLAEVLRQDPEDTAALDLLVQSYQNQFPAALERVRFYVSQKPASAVLHRFLGESLRKAGDTTGARAELQMSKSAAPRSFEADLSLAQLDIDEGKLDDARKRLRVVLESNPQDLTTRLLLGSVEARASDFPAATVQYRKAVEIDDQNVLALNNLAFLLADTGGRPEEALTLAQKAKELAPESATVQDTLGWVLYRKGLYELSIPYLEQALAKDRSERTKSHLAMAIFKSGDRQRGRQMLETAVRTSPELLKEGFVQEFLAGVDPRKP